MDRKSAARLGGLQKGINYRKQKHKALYSEPQVKGNIEDGFKKLAELTGKYYKDWKLEQSETPQVFDKSEKVVCPKPCDLASCSHRIKHNHNEDCYIPCCDAGYNNKGCIPVPSTPASEGMLTEEIAHWLSNFYYRLNNWECSIMPKTYYDSEKPLLLKREAEALLAKCHQSEAAIRADQKGKIFDVLDPLTVGSSDSDQRELLLNAIAKLQKGESQGK
jgi:hypothetical protein